MVRGMDTQAERLRHARERAGFKTASQAVRHFGWKQSTYMAHENGQNNFDAKSGEKYATAYRVSAGWLLTGEPDNAPRGTDFLARIDKDQFEDVPVVGAVQAGYWLAADEVMDEPIGVLPTVKDPSFPHLPRFAYKVVGDSFDRHVRDGGYAICVRWADTGLELRNGLAVIAQQSRDGFLQQTLKEVQGAAGNWRLVPRSTNPKHQPLELHGADQVEVIALVLHVINPMLR